MRLAPLLPPSLPSFLGLGPRVGAVGKRYVSRSWEVNWQARYSLAQNRCSLSLEQQRLSGSELPIATGTGNEMGGRNRLCPVCDPDAVVVLCGSLQTRIKRLNGKPDRLSQRKSDALIIVQIRYHCYLCFGATTHFSTRSLYSLDFLSSIIY